MIVPTAEAGVRFFLSSGHPAWFHDPNKADFDQRGGFMDLTAAAGFTPWVR
jgi:hypothetical protein